MRWAARHGNRMRNRALLCVVGEANLEPAFGKQEQHSTRLRSRAWIDHEVIVHATYALQRAQEPAGVTKCVGGKLVNRPDGTAHAKDLGCHCTAAEDVD